MKTNTEKSVLPFSLDFNIEVPSNVKFEQGAMGRDTMTYPQDPEDSPQTDDD